MKRTNSGAHVSSWMGTVTRPTFGSLGADADADVCVIGGGIAGMTTAYALVKAGFSVVLLESDVIGGGMTERTSAHLSNALDDRYFELERLHGSRGAQLAAESHSSAIDWIERIAAAEGIDCDFERVDGFLFEPPGSSKKELLRELEAVHRAGLADVELLDRAPLRFDTGPSLRFPRQAQFHPLKYLIGLARATERAGGRIFEGAHVSEVTTGETCLVRVAGGQAVTSKHVVVATNSPVNDRFAMHTKQAPYMTYVIAARIAAGSVTPALYWDTPDPYHYVRIQHTDEGDLLLVGGEDHKTGHADDADARYGRLESWMRERFPEAGGVAYRWSGQVMEPHDGLAFIGRDTTERGSVFLATGDSGHGLTHGTIAGMLISDLVVGKANEWATLYDPSRKSVRSLPTFLRENLEVAADMGKWVTGGDVSSVDEIEPGQGAIVRRGLAKLAVYRDEAGALHERSAACPHLGCVVAWNADEKSWDCPCHGSRFDCHGKVINGPSRADLARVESTQKG